MLRKISINISDNIVLKNVILLFTGTGISQLIPVVNSLFLARLYSQEAYGEQSIFLSIVGIIGAISTLRYELVIIQVKKEKDARGILLLSLISVIIISLLSFCFLYVLKSLVCSNIAISNYSILYWVPLAILCTGISNCFYNWFSRGRRYKLITYGLLWQSVSMAVSRLIFGVVGISAGLIYGLILGYLVITFYYIYSYCHDNRNWAYMFNSKLTHLKILLKEYKDFAIYSTTSGLFNALSNIGLPLIISSFYSTKVAGIYFFANNLVRLPIGLLSQSVSQVYKKEASILFYHRKVDLYPFTLKMQKVMLFFVLPILIIFSLFGGLIFSFFFGPSWKESGDMVKYFAVFIFFNSLYSPISSVMDIMRRQKLLLFFNILLILSQVIPFVCLYNTSFKYVLLLSSALGGFLFFLLDSYMKNQLKNSIYN